MKRFLKVSALALAIFSAGSLVPSLQNDAIAGPFVNVGNGYYRGGYSGYPVYGYGPYSYGTPGYSYPSTAVYGYPAYGAGPYGYSGNGYSGNYGYRVYGPYGYSGAVLAPRGNSYYSPYGAGFGYGNGY